MAARARRRRVGTACRNDSRQPRRRAAQSGMSSYPLEGMQASHRVDVVGARACRDISGSVRGHMWLRRNGCLVGSTESSCDGPDAASFLSLYQGKNTTAGVDFDAGRMRSDLLHPHGLKLAKSMKLAPLPSMSVMLYPNPPAHPGPLEGKVSCQLVCSTSQTV